MTKPKTKKEKINAKPSDSIGNEGILRAKAEESNKKREERKRRQELEVVPDITPEPDVQPQTESKPEPEVQPETDVQPEPETPKFGLGKKIKVYLDDIEMDNLSVAMAQIDQKLFGKRNDFRDSEWNKLNRKLKKDGSVEYRGHAIRLR